MVVRKLRNSGTRSGFSCRKRSSASRAVLELAAGRLDEVGYTAFIRAGEKGSKSG